MKKILLALLFVFMAQSAFAGLITFDSASSANLTVSWLNDNFYKAYNTINGNIDTNNLAEGAVNSRDIATAVNPLTRENELIGEMVYSGLTIATSATLASTITAGVAYVENDGDSTLHRVVTDATAKTFTASKDTWVYLSYTGAFRYEAVNNGSAQPSTPDNHMLIAKVVTNGTAITSVTDYRQTTPTNLRIYSDYKSGLVISRDPATATTITIGRGEVELGTTGKRRRNTASVNVNLATNGRGGLDTGSLAAGTLYYVFAIPDDDNTVNYEGIASISSTDATGVDDERLIGWGYANSASAISPDSVGAYRGVGGDAPNYIARIMSGDISTTSASYVDIPLTETYFYSSGRPVDITFSGSVRLATPSTEKLYFALIIDGITQCIYPINVEADTVDENAVIPVSLRYCAKLSEGEHIAKIQWKWSNTKTASFNDAPRVFIIEEK